MKGKSTRKVSPLSPLNKKKQPEQSLRKLFVQTAFFGGGGFFFVGWVACVLLFNGPRKKKKLWFWKCRPPRAPRAPKNFNATFGVSPKVTLAKVTYLLFSPKSESKLTFRDKKSLLGPLFGVAFRETAKVTFQWLCIFRVRGALPRQHFHPRRRQLNSSHHRVLQGRHREGRNLTSFWWFSGFSYPAKWAFSSLWLAPSRRESPEAPLEVQRATHLDSRPLYCSWRRCMIRADL